MANREVSKLRSSGNQQVSGSALMAAKSPRTLLASNFQLHKIKPNKLSFNQALVMGVRGKGGRVTAADLIDLQGRVNVYVQRYGGEKVLQRLTVQSDGLPLKPGAWTGEKRDQYPILTAQATGREVRILEVNGGNSYRETQVVYGFNPSLPGENLSLLPQNLGQSPISLLRAGDHYDFLEDLPKVSTRLTNPLFSSHLDNVASQSSTLGHAYISRREYTSLVNYLKAEGIDTTSYGLPENAIRYVDVNETSYKNYQNYKGQVINDNIQQLAEGAKLSNQLLLPRRLAVRVLDIHVDGRSDAFLPNSRAMLSNFSLDESEVINSISRGISGQAMAQELVKLPTVQEHLARFGDKSALRFLACMAAEKPQGGGAWPLQEVANALGCDTIGYTKMLDIVGNPINPLRFFMNNPKAGAHHITPDHIFTAEDIAKYLRNIDIPLTLEVKGKIRVFSPEASSAQSKSGDVGTTS
ncbi:MAG: hypothetical protein ACJAUP_001239 [Cellvibrionaceae bacterium]|jgi:hypothetical protein